MTVTIPGQPKSQKRHRTNGRRRYDPSAGDKRMIQQYLLPIKPSKPLAGKFEVSITAFFQTPTSWSEKKQKEHEGQHRPKQPDCDNIEKIILDAMNGYIIQDDGQVVATHTEKRYSTKIGRAACRERK